MPNPLDVFCCSAPEDQEMLARNGLPLSKWPDPDDAFLEILQAIEQIASKLQSR